jgi:hypothetical protein
MSHLAGKAINRRRRRLVPVAGALPTQSQLKSRRRRLPGLRSAVIACTLRSRATVPPLLLSLKCHHRLLISFTTLVDPSPCSSPDRASPTSPYASTRAPKLLTSVLVGQLQPLQNVVFTVVTTGRQRNQKVLSGANQASVCWGLAAVSPSLRPSLSLSLRSIMPWLIVLLRL